MARSPLTQHYTLQKSDRPSSPCMLHRQLTLEMVIFGSRTPISKILTAAFHSGRWYMFVQCFDAIWHETDIGFHC